DFSLWQRELLQAEQQRVQLDYWSRQLCGVTPLKLPVDAPYPAHPSGRGGVQIFDLPEPLSRDLERLSKQYSSTSFMTLLALFCALMHHYTGQDDICVGTPIAGRNQVELEDLVGFFVNTLVIRADFSCAGTFAELLGQLRKTTLEAFEHQDVPFAKLVAELKPERQSGRTPLFQVMFLMQEEPHFDYIDGLEIEPVLDVSASVAKFDLTLNVVNREQGLRCFLEYNADIFTADSAKKLLENFSSLAAWVVENVRVPFNRSVLLGVDESPRENDSPATGLAMKNRVSGVGSRCALPRRRA
ncbi:MAG: condensation domain-containing protein, partial [Exilibacterium sp.]